MPSFPFTRRTHIYNLQTRSAFIQLMHSHLANLGIRKTGSVPRLHSADEVAGKLGITGANKQAYDFFEVILTFEHQKNRLVRIEHPTCPNRKDRGSADVERARNMTATEGKHGSRVHKHASFFLDCFFESLRRKTLNARKISKYFRPTRVYFFHYRIVLRHWWRAGKRVIRE